MADGWPSARRHPGWRGKLVPVQARAGSVELRPLRRADGALWQSIRIRNETVISPWDATSSLSWAERHNRAQWHSHRSLLLSAARRGEVLPFVITLGGEFVGPMAIRG